MKIKAVIFDLDGTLLNTLSDLYLSVNHMLEKFGFPLRSEREVRSFLGSGVKVLVNKSLPPSSDAFKEECLSVFKEYYDKHKSDHTAPYQGIISMLKELHARGFLTAIVSNKYDGAVKRLKEDYFGSLVDFAVGEGQGIRIKPAPDGVEKALEALGVKKEESVYAGDSEVDYLTAKNADMNFVAVSWGFRDRAELVETGAETIIDKPDELFAAIDAVEAKSRGLR